MKLYTRDFTELNEDEKQKWDSMQKDKKTIILPSEKYSDRTLPKGIRHFKTLFPNNYIDRYDLEFEKEINEEKLNKLKEILADRESCNEQKILKSIKENEAYFIIASILNNRYYFGHHGLFLFPEFELPGKYLVDYLIVGENSHGFHFVFVELERAYENITISGGGFGTTIRKGINQIEDWDSYLDENYSNLRTVFEKELKPCEALPREFYVYDKTRMHYVVIAGRRHDFRKDEKSNRLRRKYFEESKINILHYDNLIELAERCIMTGSY